MSIGRKRAVLLLAAALVLMTSAAVMREAGYLKFDLYRVALISEVEMWDKADLESPGQFFMTRKLRSPATLTSTLTKGGYIGFNPSPRTQSLETRVNEELAARFGGDAKRASAMWPHMVSADWTPFYKRGTCMYTVSFEGKDYYIFGEVDYRVSGLLSQRALEEMLAKKIADEAVKIAKALPPAAADERQRQ